MPIDSIKDIFNDATICTELSCTVYYNKMRMVKTKLTQKYWKFSYYVCIMDTTRIYNSCLAFPWWLNLLDHQPQNNSMVHGSWV